MAFNGAGTWNLPAGQPVVSGTVISSTTHNNLVTDLQTALGTCVLKDGQQTITDDIPFNSNRITGLGDATAVTDAAKVSQVQNGSYLNVGSVSGTDTITGSLSPAPSAYASGQTFILVPANTNTGAVTVNLNSLGAKAVERRGSALTGGELLAGRPSVLRYDGTAFQIVNDKIIDYEINVIDPPDASDTGTDAYEVDLGGDLATGQTFVADIGSANTTDSPTLENTGGDPSGAQSIVTTEGAAFVDMLQARPHRFKWNGTNYVVLDPAGGIVEKASNSNGLYVRFADGTQIAWSEGVTLSGTIDAATTAGIGIASGGQRPTWTFPKTFSAAPKVTVSVTGGTTTSAFRAAGTNGAASTSSVDINLFDMDGNNSNTVTVGCIAVGKWQ